MADANSGSSTRSPAKFGSLRLLVVAAVVLAVGGLAALTVSNTLRGRALDRPVVVSQADSVEDADQPVAEIKRAMKKKSARRAAEPVIVVEATGPSPTETLEPVGESAGAAAPESAAPEFEIATEPDGAAGLAVPAPGDTPAIAPAAAEPPYATVKVFYATDRKATGKTAPNEKYSSERGTLVLGSATVAIPREHRLGALEKPSIFRLEFREDPEKHVVLLSAAEQPAADFYREVSAKVALAPDRSAFVFVHGFNVTFKDAARRTAQMAYDLGFPGAPVFYSWPSAGTSTGYTYDENNVIWTEPNLKAFIKEFAAASKADNVFLVAHSMGTRALANAVKSLIAEDPIVRAKVKEIILAAPDIDADVFKRDIAPFLIAPGRGITLYASSNDWALIASRKVHGYVRAGDAGSGLTVLTGIDTIDSSNAETDFVGHAYYASSKSIIADIFTLLHKRQRPDKRPGLTPVDAALGRYWRFVGIGTP